MIKFNKTALIVIILMTALGCSDQQTNSRYTITGIVNNPHIEGQAIVLTTYKNYKTKTVRTSDTTTIKNGKFRFTGEPYIDDFSIISTGNYKSEKTYREKLVLDSADIIIKIDTMIHISGSPLYDKMKEYDNERERFHKNWEAASNRKDSTLTRNILHQNFLEYEYKFIEENISNAVGVYYYKMRIWDLSAKYPEDFYPLLKDKDKYSHDVKYYIDKRKWEISRHRAVQNNELKYTDFEVEKLNGTKVKVSDYISKSDYVFLYIWEPWCGPSNVDIQSLKKVYNEYREKGLEILTISTSGDDVLKNTTEYLDLPFVNTSINNEMYTKIFYEYKITGIPHGVLIDKTGTIIGNNMHSLELNHKMKEIEENKRADKNTNSISDGFTMPEILDTSKPQD